MSERTGLVAMKGKGLTLIGDEIKVGQKAPDFEVVANDLSTVGFSTFLGRVCVILSVPSLDTSVCDIMTRRFDEEAEKFGDDVVVLTISMDLPFAQERWCSASVVDKVKTLSDYRYSSFGTAFGVLIKELRLLARAVFVVDRAGTIAYMQIVDELTNEPNYQSALEVVRELLLQKTKS